jgi:hypothetical protein
MKNQIKLALSFVGALAIFLTASGSVKAAVLSFDPGSTSTTAGSTFTVNVKVDPKGQQVSGTDVYVLFDSSVVTAENVQTTNLFDQINSTIDAKQVYINGYFTDGVSYIDTAGTIATITFKVNAAAVGTLQFYCDTSKADTSKIVKNDVNASNIIECSNLTLFSVNGGTAAPGTTTTSGTTTTTTTNGGSNNTVVYVTPVQQIVRTTLPQSGVFDNVLIYSIPGLAMLALGVVIKFLI